MFIPSEDHSYGVEFSENSFIITSSRLPTEVSVETPLILDQGLEGRVFQVHTLALQGMHENSVLDVNLRGKRIGLIVPSNALASTDHDYASKSFFRQCSYIIMKHVLTEGSPRLFTKLEAFSAAGSVVFSDLFHDNVCFLLLDGAALGDFAEFEFDRLLPSLAFYGFIPLTSCDPDALVWRSALPEHKKLHLISMSPEVDAPPIVARLYVLAALAAPSRLMQFFYFYQIIEHLLESVLRHRLPHFAKAMIANLSDGVGDLHDEFLVMNEQMREKVRLRLLINDYSDCHSSLDELGGAATALLKSLHLKEQFGVDAVYAVRNFLFHRARNLPPDEESTLDTVVEAFAEFLPVLLATFAVPTSGVKGTKP